MTQGEQVPTNRWRGRQFRGKMARPRYGRSPASIKTMKPAGSDYRQLISLIAHELRSPAAVVSGYLRLLLRHSAQNPSEPEPAMPSEQRMIEEANRSCA